MKKFTIGSLIFFLVLLLAAGCTSKEITRQDVIGTYVANYDKDKVSVDSIEVKADGTYTHYFKSAQDATEFTETGTWQFIGYRRGDARVDFYNFTIHFGEPDGYISEWGVWSPIVQNDGDRLLIDDDLGLHYDKQK